MQEKADVHDKSFELSAFEIIIINFVEESNKSELFEKLRGLFGDQVPVDSGFQAVGSNLQQVSPTMKFGGSIKFYSEMSLNKPLPDKFIALDISVANRITGWYEVICRGRLTNSCLLLARQQFEDKLVNEQTITTPKILEESHQELEDYLSPYIGDNITIDKESLKQKYYPCIYLGVVGNLKATKIEDIIDETNYAQSAIGFTIGIASIFRRIYLLMQSSGTLHAGETTYPIMKFSVLQLFRVQRAVQPSSWSAETKRRFARVESDYEIIDFISLMLLSRVIPAYRLVQIKSMESKNALLSRDIQDYSSTIDVGKPQDADQKLTKINRDIAKLKSAFLGEIVYLSNEMMTEDNLLKSFSDYLSKNDSDDNPREQVFVYPPNFKEHVLGNYPQNNEPITGGLSNFIQDSKSLNKELAARMSKVNDEQSAFMSYISDSINISLQNRIKALTHNLATYTIWLIILTILLIVMASVALYFNYRLLP